MSRLTRGYWMVLAIVLTIAAAAGGALAAGKLESPKQRSDAIIADAAGRLKVTPSTLSDALQKALDDQVDADVAAGRLTKAQGEALKKQIDSGQLPLVGASGRGRFGAGPPRGFAHADGAMLGGALAPAARYLGIAPAELQSELSGGKSLAQIATAHGRTADGLVAAMAAAAKARLDKAVADGHLSSAQEQKILGRLQSFFKTLVTRIPPTAGWAENGPRKGFGFHFGPRHQFRTPARTQHAAFVPGSL